MGNPCAVMAVRRLALLVRLHLRESLGVGRFVVLHRNLGGHAAHRVDVAPMACFHEQLCIALHEMRRHRDQRAIGEAEVVVAAEFLDAAEDVIPAAGVEPGGMVPQLVEDLVHLERGEDRFDQHRCLDRSARNAEVVLRHDEDVVPQPRLEMAFELRQVEVRPAATRRELLRVMEEVDREVEDAARDRFVIDEHVLFGKMPATRAHEQRCRPIVQPIRLAFGRYVIDAPPNRVAQVELALDVVFPARRVRILEVRHKYARTRVERVDDHLPVDGPGDLDATILDVARHCVTLPFAAADRGRLGQKVRQLAGVEPRLAYGAPREEFGAARAERPLQPGGEGDGVRRQDLC